jgi:hypothetical protein
MRELKGTWKDLFNGFMLALDLRKMFLGLCAIVFSMGPLALTAWVANSLEPDKIERPSNLVLGDIWTLCMQSFHVIYSGEKSDWLVKICHGAGFVIAMTAIWAFFGGAISRIAAYEIAKDGERLETGRAMKFARKKFWAFFMAPFICLIGFAFFGFCNYAGGFIGRLLDYLVIGGPIVALLLPLALLSGFIMALIVVGTAGGAPLFTPAVATEGTDAFDAVSRGFSYVYSRPWHYAWYQAVSAAYGTVCISFVILFAILMCHLGLSAGGWGFDTISPPKDSKHASFKDVTRTSWSLILDEKCEAAAPKLGESYCPYPYLMHWSHQITGHKHTTPEAVDVWMLPGGHRVTAWIIIAWLVLTLGLALGYLPSYVISQQTMIYYVMRKKVDGIEMNEVFEEPEADEKPLAPVPPAGEKPASPPVTPAAPSTSSPDKPADPPKAG